MENALYDVVTEAALSAPGTIIIADQCGLRAYTRGEHISDALDMHQKILVMYTAEITNPLLVQVSLTEDHFASVYDYQDDQFLIALSFGETGVATMASIDRAALDTAPDNVRQILEHLIQIIYKNKGPEEEHRIWIVDTLMKELKCHRHHTGEHEAIYQQPTNGVH